MVLGAKQGFSSEQSHLLQLKGTQLKVKRVDSVYFQVALLCVLTVDGYLYKLQGKLPG